MQLATIKHISSKNANYGAAELYLTFQHDEFTNKPVLDDKGRMIPRDDFRMETILCGDEDFAIACMRANLKYGKNNQRGDVKSHHYIISFDPRDGTENGLTMDKAQQLGAPSDLDRIVDMNYAQSKGGGYAHWASLHNLKTMSATLIAYQEAGFESPEAMDAALVEAHDAVTEKREKVKSFESVIKDKKEFRRQIQIYRKAAPLYEEYKQIKRKSKQEDFYRAHEPDFILRESALRYFKSHGIKKLPTLKALNAEIEDLISQENEAYNEYHSAQDHEKELRAIKQNIDRMLSREQTEQTQPSKKKHRHDPEL